MSASELRALDRRLSEVESTLKKMNSKDTPPRPNESSTTYYYIPYIKQNFGQANGRAIRDQHGDPINWDGLNTVDIKRLCTKELSNKCVGYSADGDLYTTNLKPWNNTNPYNFSKRISDGMFIKDERYFKQLCTDMSGRTRGTRCIVPREKARKWQQIQSNAARKLAK